MKNLAGSFKITHGYNETNTMANKTNLSTKSNSAFGKFENRKKEDFNKQSNICMEFNNKIS